MTDDVRTPDEEAADPDDQQVEGADRPLPPIPDGGLGAGMPDWLTRPTPATLRRLARRQGSRRPEAADFARAEDVPGWLAAIRERDEAGAVADAAVPTPTPAFPRIEPVFVDARPAAPVAELADPAMAVPDGSSPPAMATPAQPSSQPAPTTTPTVIPRVSPPPAPIPTESGGTSTAWIVIAVLLALAIAFGIGMLTGAGYRP